jgi:hypothetical protein
MSELFESAADTHQGDVALAAMPHPLTSSGFGRLSRRHEAVRDQVLNAIRVPWLGCFQLNRKDQGAPASTVTMVSLMCSMHVHDPSCRARYGARSDRLRARCHVTAAQRVRDCLAIQRRDASTPTAPFERRRGFDIRNVSSRGAR